MVASLKTKTSYRRLKLFWQLHIYFTKYELPPHYPDLSLLLFPDDSLQYCGSSVLFLHSILHLPILQYVGAAPGPPLLYMTKHFALFVSHAIHLVISVSVPAPWTVHSHSLCIAFCGVPSPFPMKYSAGKVSGHIG